MIVLGLTGSIGMGKTTTAALFADAGAAVYDADAAVHDLYRAGGAAGPALRSAFPDAVADDGAVLRDRLKAALAREPARLSTLEAIVFPLMGQRRASFLDAARDEGRTLAVLDIPLLYETGGETTVDAVVLVTAPPEVQNARVRARGMDEQTFELLRSRQLDDAQKRRRADFIVYTDQGIDAARSQVQVIVDVVLAPGWRRPRGRTEPVEGPAVSTGRPQ